MKRGGGKEKVLLKNGQAITIEVKPSGWKNVNETIGYSETLKPHTTMVEDLGVNEIRSKNTERLLRQTAVGAGKEQRASENR